MLPERTFAIGGYACIALGGAFALSLLSDVGSPVLLSAIETSVWLIGLGAFFLYVSRQARQSRQRLLASVTPIVGETGRTGNDN
jgi:hypothetical protein